MERFAADVLASTAENSDRLRLLNWGMFGLVFLLDEEKVRARDSGWMGHAKDELARTPEPESAVNL